MRDCFDEVHFPSFFSFFFLRKFVVLLRVCATASRRFVFFFSFFKVSATASEWFVFVFQNVQQRTPPGSWSSYLERVQLPRAQRGSSSYSECTQRHMPLGGRSPFKECVQLPQRGSSPPFSECVQLNRPQGAFLACTEELSPYLKTCNLTCLPGFMSPTPFPLYTCGEKTGYVWNHQRDHQLLPDLPSCTRESLALFASCLI